MIEKGQNQTKVTQPHQSLQNPKAKFGFQVDWDWNDG
jgi:hypothetical protein